MSLQAAAQHLASRGRGPDTQLVHMAPQEVAGLQALARAAGGTLTVNPETGLAEAGFLKRLLPTIIGAGLAATGIGAPMAAMLVGGGTAAMTGDIKKGLMAGLGAYGGAGLGAGLNAAAATAGQGATALTAPVEGLTSVGGQSVSQAANAIGGNLGSSLAGFDTGVNSALQATGAMQGNLGMAGVNAAAPAAQAAQAASQAMPAGFEVFNATPTNFGAFGEAPLQAAVTPPIDSSFSANYAVGPKALGVAPTTPEPNVFSKVRTGLQALNSARGREAFLGKAATKDSEATGVGGYAGLARSGLSALAPAMMAAEPTTPPKGSGPNPYRYRFEQEFPEGPNADGSAEALQYRGSYVPYADGGPVQGMSDRNEALTLMANGGQQFAAGGATGSGSLDLHIPIDLGGGSQGAVGFGGGASGYEAIGAGAQQRFSGFNNTAGGGFGSPNNPFMSAPAPLGQNPNQPILTRPADASVSSTTSADMMSSRSPEEVGKAFSLMRNVLGGQPLAAADGGLMGLAAGGISHLGDYSDGGRLLRGPGDGVSDSIPATIANKRPARLADGEFVVPARIVSELGNGSTEAGARKLYAMMDRVQNARKKSIGKKRVAVNSRADKALPA